MTEKEGAPTLTWSCGGTRHLPHNTHWSSDPPRPPHTRCSARCQTWHTPTPGAPQSLHKTSITDRKTSCNMKNCSYQMNCLQSLHAAVKDADPTPTGTEIKHMLSINCILTGTFWQMLCLTSQQTQHWNFGTDLVSFCYQSF